MQDIPQKPYVYFADIPKIHLLKTALLAGIVKIPTTDKNNTPMTYSDLLCTDSDKNHIYEIITTMAENGKFSLLLKQSYLKQLGAEINHVHPLKFLSTIFTNSRLKECMGLVFDDYFKRNGFLDGLAPSLSKEADKGKLFQYADDFAKELNVPVEGIMQYFHSRDWESFVRYLMKS